MNQMEFEQLVLENDGVIVTSYKRERDYIIRQIAHMLETHVVTRKPNELTFDTGKSLMSVPPDREKFRGRRFGFCLARLRYNEIDRFPNVGQVILISDVENLWLKS